MGGSDECSPSADLADSNAQADAVPILAAEQAPPATPLPKKKLFPILLILLCEAYLAESLYAYVGYMMVDLGMAENKDKSGFSAGMLSSSFYIAQFLCSFVWGYVSDRIGRRPVLLIGCAGSLITSAMFGFSKTYTLAIIARSLCGLVNGNIGAVKTYLAEVTDATNRVRAFGLVGLMWGVGGVIGSSAGGLTVRLAVKYPSHFSPTGFFGQFPYAVPNLISAGLMLIALTLSYIFLVEPENSPARQYRRPSMVASLELEFIDESAADSIYEEVEDSPRDLVPLTKIADPEPARRSNRPIATVSQPHPDPHPSFLQKTKDRLKSSCGGKRLCTSGSGASELFKTKLALIAISMYGLIGFSYTIFGTVYPLFLIAPSGGFNFTTDDVGFNNAVGGFTAIVVQLLIYTPVANRIGLLRTLQIGLFMAVPLFIGLPALGTIAPSISSMPAPAFKSIVYALYAVHSLASEAAFSAVMTMICNSVPNRLLGSVNGLSQSVVGLLRGIGPFAGASALQWSLTNGLFFPVNKYFVFIILCIVLVSVLGIAFRAPKELNHPFIETAAPPTAGANHPARARSSDSVSHPTHRKLSTSIIDDDSNEDEAEVVV